jgi:hypothetical protein
LELIVHVWERRKKKNMSKSLGDTGDTVLSQCLELVKDIMREPLASPFNTPVDTALYYDYLQRVANPMDFGTIRANLEAQKYSDALQFAADMHLVFSNCFVFNVRESSIVDWAHSLKAMFDKRFAEITDMDIAPVCDAATSSARASRPSVRSDAEPTYDSSLVASLSTTPAAAATANIKKRGTYDVNDAVLKQAKARCSGSSSTAASSAAVDQDREMVAKFEGDDPAQRKAVFDEYAGRSSMSEFEQCVNTLIETAITHELPLLAGAVIKHIRRTEGAIYDDVWVRLLEAYFERGANATDRKFYIWCLGRIVYCCRQAGVRAEEVAKLISGTPERQAAADRVFGDLDVGECLRRLDEAAPPDVTPQVLERQCEKLANMARFDELKSIDVVSARLPSLPLPAVQHVTPAHEAGERRGGPSKEQKEAGEALAAEIDEIVAGKQFKGVSVCFVVPPRQSLVEQTRLRVASAGLGDALVVSPSQSASEEAKLFTFAGEALMDPERLFVLVVDECHWGIDSEGLLCARFLHQPTLRDAAAKNGNVVSVHVSATPENNLVVPGIRQVVMPRAAAYQGFRELCNDEVRRLVDSEWTKEDKKENSDANLCVDYARALTARAAAFGKAPMMASAWMRLSASERVADELLRRWYVNEPGLVVLRLPTADAAKMFTEHLDKVVRELGMQEREHGRRRVEVLYELGGERNWAAESAGEARSKNYEKLLENRLAFFVLVSMCQMGDTFPPSLFAYDTRARFYAGNDGKLESSRSTFLQDVGRAFGYGRENVRVIFGREVGALVRDEGEQMFAKIDAYVERRNASGSDPAYVASKTNMFSEPADAVLAKARVILVAEPQCGKTGAYLEAVRLLVARRGGFVKVDVAEPAKPPLSDIEWQLPKREFVERRVACKQLGFGKYHERVQRMRVQMLVESESVSEYARKVARIECVIVPMRERRMPEWHKESGAFRFESARDVERFRELVDFDSKERGVLREWALLLVANDDAGDPLLQQPGTLLKPGAVLQAGVWYTLDVPYRSTSSLFMYQHNGTPLAASVDVAVPQDWICLDGGEGRNGRLLVRESERARFAAADKKAWCFVVSRREHDAQLRKLAQYDVGERPLVVVVVSSQFGRYQALVENSAALERAALLVLPAQLSGADVKDVLPELESIGWSHRIDEQLSAGYARLVVQLFARWRGLELIHMLDDNIDSGRLFRRRRGVVEKLERLDDALTVLECCIEPTDDQKREAELVKFDLHPNACGKIVLVGCSRSPRAGAMMRAVNAMSMARPYSMVLLNAKLARDQGLWYRPKPVWEDVDLIDDARAKNLAVVKMNGLAHFKAFCNNANRQRAVRGSEEDECDDGDDDYDDYELAPQPMVEDVIVVTEETFLEVPVSEGTYVIESNSGRGAALIANVLLRRAEGDISHASVRVRVAATQAQEFEDTVARFLTVARDGDDLTITKK